ASYTRERASAVDRHAGERARHARAYAMERAYAERRSARDPGRHMHATAEAANCAAAPAATTHADAATTHVDAAATHMEAPATTPAAARHRVGGKRKRDHRGRGDRGSATIDLGHGRLPACCSTFVTPRLVGLIGRDVSRSR